jgi:uncharacterized protein (TIGR03083 family)
MTDVATITPIDRTEMVGLATTEYHRLGVALRSLDASDWGLPTICAEWDVRQMIAHLLGAAESNASLRENVHQLRRGRRWARERGRPDIDGINAVQVEERDHLSPAELIDRLDDVAPRAVAGRRRTPALVRRVRIDDGIGGRMTIEHLVDRVYTRDQWLHRIDLNEAVRREPLLTDDHDRRIVEDVVCEWADVHGEPFELDLSGPAGGRYHAGSGGPQIEMDAVEFCLVLSGRLDKEMPLFRPIVF